MTTTGETGIQKELLDFPVAKDARCPFDPAPAITQAQRTSALTRVQLWDGTSCWLVTGYDTVRQVLADPTISAEATDPGFPFLVPGVRELVRQMRPTLFRQDDPEHARLRRMLTADFTGKRVDQLRPQIQQLTDDLLEKMTLEHDQGDLVEEFAGPLPSEVTCLVLGVPYEDREFFQKRTALIHSTSASSEQVRSSQQELIAYLTDVAAAKRRRPDDTLLGRLAVREDLDIDQVASTGRLLLVAGHETTTNMIALSTLALLVNPGQADRLREQPELIRPAVEELLRYLTIVHNGIPRVATADLTIEGQRIRAGEGVLCMVNTANRDDAAFAAPDELDLDREARHHLAFGFGVHQCLGQPLARAELQIALSSLLRRLPGLRLNVPFEELSFREDSTLYGLRALPVAW